jgi:hypothetical protein
MGVNSQQSPNSGTANQTNPNAAQAERNAGAATSTNSTTNQAPSLATGSPNSNGTSTLGVAPAAGNSAEQAARNAGASKTSTGQPIGTTGPGAAQWGPAALHQVRRSLTCLSSWGTSNAVPRQIHNNNSGWNMSLVYHNSHHIETPRVVSIALKTMAMAIFTPIYFAAITVIAVSALPFALYSSLFGGTVKPDHSFE